MKKVLERFSTVLVKLLLLELPRIMMADPEDSLTSISHIPKMPRKLSGRVALNSMVEPSELTSAVVKDQEVVSEEAAEVSAVVDMVDMVDMVAAEAPEEEDLAEEVSAVVAPEEVDSEEVTEEASEKTTVNNQPLVPG